MQRHLCAGMHVHEDITRSCNLTRICPKYMNFGPVTAGPGESAPTVLHETLAESFEQS